MKGKEYNCIQFRYLVTPKGFTNKIGLKKFLFSVIANYDKKVQAITFIFCSDEFLLKINRNFLKHDFFTDIITFDLSESSARLTAEIYISVDRVSDNANVLKQAFIVELHRVIFHGILHLLGFNDKKATDGLKMRDTEDQLLTEYLFHVK